MAAHFYFGSGVVGAASRDEPLHPVDAGIVDQQIDIGAAGGGSGHLGGVGDVELQGFEAIAVPGGKVGQHIGLAGGGINLGGAAGQQGHRYRTAEASIGAGDQRCATGNVHGSVSWGGKLFGLASPDWGLEAVALA